MEFSERFRQVVDEHNSRRGDEAFANEVLDESGYPPVTHDDVYTEVLEQAENFKKYNDIEDF